MTIKLTCRFFSDNLGDHSEEQGERFHQDIKTMETRYQGRWNVNMMADYCWSLARDITEDTHKENYTQTGINKWMSNKPEVIRDLTSSITKVKLDNRNKNEKALRLRWRPNTDTSADFDISSLEE
ncbi:hypothetical protein EVAR_2591_1 [Eumeta japonica]|uniref:Uncharacterized protein n=1 Tax=Eumeta variegata TaxID=151549 RepID=A0A4C1SMC5_EUMVA|nr:hypothetical protein EVAR_2591_1 [Eumeta japonica]